MIHPGTWESAIATRARTRFDPHRRRHVVVVAAHPDDETLGCGGLLHALAHAGARLTLVLATDGEAAYPDLDDQDRDVLAHTRRAEWLAALADLGAAQAELVTVQLPDSDLMRCVADLIPVLRTVLADADTCLAPWIDDPHPDHRAAGFAAAAACAANTPLWWYPIWARPWTDPDAPTVPWERAAQHRLTTAEREAKKRALARFSSQLHAPEPVLPPQVVAHFTGEAEVVFSARPVSTTTATFDAHYARDPDPWRTADSTYEHDKRAVTLENLPRRRYRRALDAGCGTGVLSAELARRCGSLVAVDASAHAVQTTSEALADQPDATVRQARLPDGFPDGPFDLIVFSELLYYLTPHDLMATLHAATAAAAPGADLVVVTWRHRAHDAPLTADHVHELLAAAPDWQQLREHRDPDFLLHVVRRQ